MDKWQQFLNQISQQHSGAKIVDYKVTSFIAPLSELGLLSFSGEDAAHFLHGQLTNDIEHLGVGDARLAGYCTAKGRLLATLLVWKSPESIMALLPREILQSVQKRLQMFILRAKVKSSDVSEQHVILGLSGASAATTLSKWFDAMPTMPYTTASSNAGKLIRVADAWNEPRYIWITEPDIAITSWNELTSELTQANSNAWRLAEIRAGIPQVTLNTQEKFVPQMVNFELIGGVNFKKGCYPGQEIVARSQYLGKLKRRMMLATIETQDAKPGMEVFASADPEQPCGMIVNAEHSAPNQVDCLVELKISALDAGSIHLGGALGAKLKFHSLPYTLPSDAE